MVKLGNEFQESDDKGSAPADGFIWANSTLCDYFGKRLLAEIVALAKSESYESLYLWTDSSCNHSYYAHHGFEMVAEFKNDEWKTDSDDYLTYIYRKSFR